MLREAFEELGGGEDAPLHLSALFAALTHFKPDATFDDARSLARSAVGSERPMDFSSFCSFIMQVRSTYSIEERLFGLLDSPGVGLVSDKDLVSQLTDLYQPLNMNSDEQLDEINTMIASLPHSKPGFVSREDFTKTHLLS